ncbi:MAG: DHA2 family efflux MFS transporter permease subunit [Balneolales bacterium]
MNTRKGSDAASPPPIPARIWKIAAATGAGAFIAMLDSTVANLAIESIRDDLNSTIPVIQWVATGYLIALAISLPATGWLGSRFGHGRVWSVSLVMFTIGSALCAVAPGPLSLIGARLLQGLAAGVMVPSGQAILGVVAGPKQLGRVMGSIGLVVALGPAVGPAFGGFLLEVASWRSLFWINVPLGIITLMAARGLVPAGETKNDRPLDWKGFILIGLGLPLILYGATEIGSNEITLLTFLAVGIGVVLAIRFILSSIQIENPLIDLTLLKRGSFAAAASTTGLTGANMYGGLLLLPLYLQLTAGQDVLETGFMLLAMGLGTAVALYFGGMLTDYYSAGPVTVAGAFLLVITTVPFMFVAEFSIPILVLLLVIRGIGLALAQMPAYTAAYASVTDEQMGDAATVVNITQRIGGAIGAIGLVIILAQLGGSNSSDAYIWAFGGLT